MREIKFRAWDKKGQMHHGEDVSFVRGRFVKSSYTACWWLDEAQLLNGQQYTGLKDVNGVEIYEGDIVRVVADDGSHYISTVKWEVGDYYPAFDLDKTPSGYWYDSNVLQTISLGETGESMKVIENIYENPELLQNDGVTE